MFVEWINEWTAIVNLHLGNAADQEACCVSSGNLFYIQMISPCFSFLAEKGLGCTELPFEQHCYLGQLLLTSQNGLLPGNTFLLSSQVRDKHPNSFFFLILLKYSWFTMLCYFLLYSKVTQLYVYIFVCVCVYMYISFFVFFSITVCHRILNLVPCAVHI